MCENIIHTLVQEIRTHFNSLKDPRKGLNKKYMFSDILMACFSLFYLQSPSFLAYQDRLNRLYKKHNGKTLFSFEEIPSDNHIRSILDKIETHDLTSLIKNIHTYVPESSFKLDDHIIVAMDGIFFFSSEKISCECCLKRKNGNKTTHYHAMLAPMLIHPEQEYALPLLPEFIQPQDGSEKQDCESNSAKRWLENHKQWLTEKKAIILGDDLFSRGPLINQIMSYSNVNFIFVAKETSHKVLKEQIDEEKVKNAKLIREIETKGKKKYIFEYQIFNHLSLNGDPNSPKINYFEMRVFNTKKKQVYFNTFVTNFELTAKNIHKIARIGRSRWKIENEAFNILKTKGYNLEHNFGHGKVNLANNIATLNLLSFLVHQVCELNDVMWKNLRTFCGARKRFFEDFSMALSVQVYENWTEFINYFYLIIKPVKGKKKEADETCV